jgi:hypothetical protein
MADEWSLIPSRPVLRAGRAIVQMANIGEDDHDLRIQRISPAGRPTGVISRIRRLGPDQQGEARLVLRVGRYRLVCTIADHAKRGMRATIRVRAAR